MLPNLNDILKYENEKVIERYQRDYASDKSSSKRVFVELLKYIWLCLKHKIDREKLPNDSSLEFECVMHAEMIDIDNMWHTFLLFTKDYHNFCKDYLDGNFFHHEPFSTTKVRLTKEQYEIQLFNYLAYIYDNLGETTVNAWFDR